MKILQIIAGSISKALGDEPVKKVSEFFIGDKSKKFEVAFILIGVIWAGGKLGWLSQADVEFWMSIISPFTAYFGVIKMNKFKKSLRKVAEK